MSGLNEVRRWVNLSQHTQRVMQPSQGAFTTVEPKGYVEGKQYVNCCNNPYLRETTSHLTQQDFVERLPDENDVDLLIRLATIETNEINPRPSVIKLIEDRIRKIVKARTSRDDDAADAKNSGGPSTQTPGAGAVGTADARP